MAVQEAQRLSGLAEVGQDTRARESGTPPLSDELGEIGSVDPIHHEDVVVALEEVLPDQRQRRMRLQPEQGSALPQKVTAVAVVANRSQLERHHAREAVIQRLDHSRRADAAHGFQQLVPTLEQRHPCFDLLRHRHFTPFGASRPRDYPWRNGITDGHRPG
jgi:hypothetical protein